MVPKASLVATAKKESAALGGGAVKHVARQRVTAGSSRHIGTRSVGKERVGDEISPGSSRAIRGKRVALTFGNAEFAGRDIDPASAKRLSSPAKKAGPRAIASR